MNEKDKRSDIRIPILNENVVIRTVSLEKYAYKLSNVSKNGIFIKLGPYEKLMAPNSFVVVQIDLPKNLGRLMLTGTVCRTNWGKKIDLKKGYYPGFAVKFENIDVGEQRIWDAFIFYLRNKQIMIVSKRIIQEFFGNMRRPRL